MVVVRWLMDRLWLPLITLIYLAGQVSSDASGAVPVSSMR